MEPIPFFLREKMIKQREQQTAQAAEKKEIRENSLARGREKNDLQYIKSYNLFPQDPFAAQHHFACSAVQTNFQQQVHRNASEKTIHEKRENCLFPKEKEAPQGEKMVWQRDGIGNGNFSKLCLPLYPDPPERMNNHSSVNVWQCSNNLFLNVATAHTRGYRGEMEDVFIDYKGIDEKGDALGNILVCGVCDGHGGSQVSDWLKDNLGPCVVQSLRRGESLVKAFENAQKLLETQLSKFVTLNIGSTCCIAVIFPKHNIYYIANSGDSRAVIVDTQNTITGSRRVTQDHKPDDAVEKARIEAARGFVTETMGVARINGQLSVSRGFGDGSLRDYGVTEKPDIFGPFVLYENNAIVLACDGLYDVVTDAGVSAMTTYHLNGCVAPISLEKSVIAQRAVEQLRNLAFASHSSDNISVMLIAPFKN